MKLLIAGGGTGGHVFPMLAVAQEWLRRIDPGATPTSAVDITKREVVIVGTTLGLEARLVPQAGLPLQTIRVAGLKGIGGMKFLKNAAMLPASAWDSRKILRRDRFVAAFGVGGYASGPVIALAAFHRVPTVIFEPNIEPGFTTRVLAGIATRVATGFEETAKRLGKKAVVTGIPVRREFFTTPVRQHTPPLNILITGGSRGALPINRVVAESLDLLAARKNQLFIVHQTGERDYNAVRVAYARREFNAEPLYRKYGGAVCPGGRNRLPRGRNHRGGNRRRWTCRHLHSLRSRHRRSSTSQCPRHGIGRCSHGAPAG
jgi:UDP-N-acetylglucosamine--N-acetylmuramyl-(pentapeptide) pyrophosphoryl-undecaprenol N-acetylglucosamine transferase